MKGLKISVAFLTIAVAGLVGYVVYKEGFVKEENTMNTLEYENKISTLEKENKQLQEEIKIKDEKKCERTTVIPKFTGTYSFGDPNQKDTCGETPDKIFQSKITFHENGTAEFIEILNCGSGYGGSGKYYVNDSEIVIMNEECDHVSNCVDYAIFNYDGDNISAEASYMGTTYTINLVKE